MGSEGGRWEATYSGRTWDSVGERPRAISLMISRVRDLGAQGSKRGKGGRGRQGKMVTVQ